ncbi:MAG: PorT family protein [Spirochaetes bacterium]|nr:PorT family protein [Spirochaetota bacterium]
MKKTLPVFMCLLITTSLFAANDGKRKDSLRDPLVPHSLGSQGVAPLSTSSFGHVRASTPANLTYSADDRASTSRRLLHSEIKIGIALGLNHTWASGNDWDDIKKELGNDGSSGLGLGFEAGVFLNFKINDYFSIQPELNFLYLRARAWAPDIFEFDTREFIVMAKLLEIPLLAKFTIDAGQGRLSFFFGPALMIILGNLEARNKLNLHGYFSWAGTHKTPPDDRMIFAGAIGTDYALPWGNGKLIFDVRYRRTFSDNIRLIYGGAKPYGIFSIKTNSIGLRIGYAACF